MAISQTYVPIYTQTGNGTSTTITFNSIPSTYTDLIAVLVYQSTSANYIGLTVNNNGSSIYSFTQIDGNGTAASNARIANQSNSVYELTPTSPNINNTIIHFMNYSNSITNKSWIMRTNTSTGDTREIAGLIQTTSPISRIDFSDGSFTSPTTITLYGIQAA